MAPFDLRAMRNDQKTQETRATIKTIYRAIAAFQPENGRFPSEAEGPAVLTPTFLPVLPLDAWGMPFRYEFTEAGCPVIRSAGWDRKFDRYADIVE